MQEQLAYEENAKDEPKPTKWYMGEYAVNEGVYASHVQLRYVI